MPLISIASVPTAHRYVAHLDSVDAAAPARRTVVRLPDPRPVGAGVDDPRWWPPRWLEPAWLNEHIDEFDVLHIHFGFDTCAPEQLQAVLDIAHRAGKPVVVTVHDLHNPHFVDSTMHHAQLGVLIPSADAVLTLTDGAADEIERRWGRRPVVVPHPHVVPLDLVGIPRPHHDGFVIGLHAKSFRANMDPVAIIGTLVAVAEELDDARVRVDLDGASVADIADGPAAALLAYRDHPRVDVRVHPRFTDDELWRYLTDIDVSVLPYRFGTHSGWLEACHDVGTAVVVGDCGHHARQRPVHGFGFGVDRFDRESLVRALHAAHGTRAPMATRDDRVAERAVIADIHDHVYDSARQRISPMAGAR